MAKEQLQILTDKGRKQHALSDALVVLKKKRKNMNIFVPLSMVLCSSLFYLL